MCKKHSLHRRTLHYNFRLVIFGELQLVSHDRCTTRPLQIYFWDNSCDYSLACHLLFTVITIWCERSIYPSVSNVVFCPYIWVFCYQIQIAFSLCSSVFLVYLVCMLLFFFFHVLINVYLVHRSCSPEFLCSQHITCIQQQTVDPNNIRMNRYPKSDPFFKPVITLSNGWIHSESKYQDFILHFSSSCFHPLWYAAIISPAVSSSFSSTRSLFSLSSTTWNPISWNLKFSCESPLWMQ